MIALGIQGVGAIAVAHRVYNTKLREKLQEYRLRRVIEKKY
jgi:hypothetical protein